MNFKKISVVVCFFIFGFGILQAQDLETFKADKAKVMADIATKKAELAALEAKVVSLQTEIEKLSGWMTGFGGTVGFGFNKSTNWVSNPNANASSSRLAIGLSGFANNIKEKTLWRNSLVVAKEWQDIDKDGDPSNSDKLFENGTVDILNLSSLGGYRINSKLAATAQGELNTSLGKFLKPGTLDFGVGVTWTPMNSLIVMVHPLNYHVTFSGYKGVKTAGALGAKLRAEYNNKFNILGQAMTFSSTLTSFIPYSDKKTLVEIKDAAGTVTDSWNAGLFEYTWINNLGFNLFKGVGVGLGFGLRNAQLESQKIQNYYSLGINYAL